MKPRTPKPLLVLAALEPSVKGMDSKESYDRVMRQAFGMEEPNFWPPLWPTFGVIVAAVLLFLWIT